MGKHNDVCTWTCANNRRCSVIISSSAKRGHEKKLKVSISFSRFIGHVSLVTVKRRRFYKPFRIMSSRIPCRRRLALRKATTLGQSALIAATVKPFPLPLHSIFIDDDPWPPDRTRSTLLLFDFSSFIRLLKTFLLSIRLHGISTGAHSHMDDGRWTTARRTTED